MGAVVERRAWLALNGDPSASRQPTIRGSSPAIKPRTDPAVLTQRAAGIPTEYWIEIKRMQHHTLHCRSAGTCSWYEYGFMTTVMLSAMETQILVDRYMTDLTSCRDSWDTWRKRSMNDRANESGSKIVPRCTRGGFRQEGSC